MYLVRPSYLIKKLYPKATWRMNKSEKKIFLTFDDGPVPEITDWVLNILKEKNIKATFFCVGDNVKKHPELFQRILNDGHSVGNHTQNHLNGWKTSKDDYVENVKLCEEAFQKFPDQPPEISGKQNLFRPPYGKLKQSQLSSLTGNYSIIMWDVLSGDYDTKTSPERCFQNATGYLRNGSIIVFHDSYKAEKNLKYTLPLFIDFAFREDYQFGVI
jgi:peptidoglycan-N-acetylglucosamine deacetylase